MLSGKALFKYDPTLFRDDEDAADEKIYEEREEEEEEERKESDVIRNGNANNGGPVDMIKSSVPTNNGSAADDTKVDADLFK